MTSKDFDVDVREVGTQSILEGALSIIDVSGTTYFNTYRRYSPNQNLRTIWVSVGSHFNNAVCQYEKDRELLKTND